MKLIITEQQYNRMFEMAYPVTFNMEEFKQLRSFAERYRYCKQKLEYISSGSGRYVFGIDEEKVLKLAKNQKGVAQNEHEYELSNDGYPTIVANVFDADEDFLWIEMERVNKITPKKFREMTGITFDDFSMAINYEYYNHKGGQNFRRKPENMTELWENEFFQDVVDIMINFGLPSGDLGRINSYGINRQGQIKLIDAGLSEEIYNDYYKR